LLPQWHCTLVEAEGHGEDVGGVSFEGSIGVGRGIVECFEEAALGLGVIAPEQEMINEEFLPFVPEHRLDDVLYFNPTDDGAPISSNTRHLDEGEDLDLWADENMTIVSRLLGKYATPRTNEILTRK